MNKSESILISEVPAPASRRRRLSREELLTYLIYAAFSLLFTLVYLRLTFTIEQQPLPALATFQAQTPFQYRILMPLLVRALHLLLPLKYTMLFHLLVPCFTFAMLVAFRNYLALFFPAGFSRFAALALLYPLFWNYGPLCRLFYPADVPAIFFFILGLIFLRKQQWTAYYPLLILATLNRETSCFLIFAFLLTQWGRERPGQLAAHLLLQSVIWLSIQYSLRVIFRHNLGAGTFENHWAANLTVLGEIFSFFTHGRINLHGTFALLGNFGWIWILIPLAWREQPLFFKRLLWIVIPFCAGMSVVGNLDEVRLYNELLPILTAPAIFSVRQWLRAADENRPAAAMA